MKILIFSLVICFSMGLFAQKPKSESKQKTNFPEKAITAASQIVSSLPTCNICSGTGKIICSNCRDWSLEYKRKRACDYCKDTRKVNCKVCGGSGKFIQQELILSQADLDAYIDKNSPMSASSKYPARPVDERTKFIEQKKETISTPRLNNVTDIISSYLLAMGGIEKMSSLKTYKKSGVCNVQGLSMRITDLASHMQGERFEYEIYGASNYQIVNKQNGYTFSSLNGENKFEKIDPKLLKNLQDKLDIQGVMLNYKEKGITIEFIGNEGVENEYGLYVDAYKLRISNKLGRVFYYFLDIKTNLIIKSSEKVIDDDGTESDDEIFYRDYKQNIDGYWFPYSVTIKLGTILFDKIETNIEINENVFRK